MYEYNKITNSLYLKTFYIFFLKINHYICNLNITHFGYTHHTPKKQQNLHL